MKPISALALQRLSHELTVETKAETSLVWTNVWMKP